MTLTSFSRSHQHFELSNFILRHPHSFLSSCLHSIFWTNGWILTKLTHTHYWDGGKKWSDFKGHHTIKTVKISLVCTLSPEPNGGFLPNLHRNTIGTWERNDLVFGDLDLIFKLTPTFWMSSFGKKKLVCVLSLEPNDGFLPNFMYCIIGIIKRID